MYLPAAVYKVGAPIVIPPFVTLQGDSAPVLKPQSVAIAGSVLKLSSGWNQGAAADSAAVLLLGRTSGGYSGQSQDQALRWLSIDGSGYTATVVHGISAYDSAASSVNNVDISHIEVFRVTGNGLYVHSGSGALPLAWRISHCSFQQSGVSGIKITDSMTDTTWTDVYVIGTGIGGGNNDGISLTTCSNSVMIGCRSEDTTGNGFSITSANNSGNPIRLVGCSTQGNTYNGFLLTSTSAAPICLVGCQANNDGQNGGAGGGGYAGFAVTGLASVAQLTGCSVVPGGSSYPQYGLSVTSNTGGYVLVSNGILWGITAGVGLDNSSTAVILDPSTIQMAGAPGSVAYTLPGAKMIAASSANLVPTATEDLLGSISGALAVSMPRGSVTSNTQATSSGQGYFRQSAIPAGVTITNLAFRVGSVAKTGGTHGWYVLCDKSFKVLAVSTDQTDPATTWGTLNTDQALAVTTNGTAKYVTTYTGVYYAIFMVANSAGTQPTLAGTGNLATGIGSGTPVLCGTCAGAANTTPPAVGSTIGTVSAIIGDNFYCYAT